MRRLSIVALASLALVNSAAFCAGEDRDFTKSFDTASPDGRIKIEVSLQKTDKSASVPHYRVTFKGRDVVQNSPLRVDLVDGTILGSNSLIEDWHTTAIHAEYHQYPSKRSTVVDHCSEAVISLREAEKPARQWQLVVRAYDDGVAFRYRRLRPNEIKTANRCFATR